MPVPVISRVVPTGESSQVQDGSVSPARQVGICPPGQSIEQVFPKKNDSSSHDSARPIVPPAAGNDVVLKTTRNNKIEIWIEERIDSPLQRNADSYIWCQRFLAIEQRGGLVGSNYDFLSKKHTAISGAVSKLAISRHPTHGVNNAQRLAAHGLEVSMSRRGNCWDNAPMENFFSTLKTEPVRRCDFTTLRQAQRELFEYSTSRSFTTASVDTRLWSTRVQQPSSKKTMQPEGPRLWNLPGLLKSHSDFSSHLENASRFPQFPQPRRLKLRIAMTY